MERNRASIVEVPAVVVIGGGLGGLTAGAYLSRAGLRVLVLDSALRIGGKCATRELQGLRFAVGANTFGHRTIEILRELDVELPRVRASNRMVVGDVELLFPPDLSTLRGLRRLGVGVSALARASLRVLRSSAPPVDGRSSYADVVQGAIADPVLRELLELEAWYLGAHPCALSKESFGTFMGPRYGFHRPFYPEGGAGAIPDALAAVIRSNGGEVRTSRMVNRISVEKRRATGVEADGEWIPALRAVVSNADVRDTLRLTEDPDGDERLALLRKETARFRSALPLGALLLAIEPRDDPLTDALAGRRAPTSSLLHNMPVRECIEACEAGVLPERSILNVVAAEAILAHAHGSHELPVTVLSLWPRSQLSATTHAAFVDRALAELDRAIPGAANSARPLALVPPESYEETFGFTSCPAPVLDTRECGKPSFDLPVRGLYNVGTTVLPTGCHSAAAMESGRQCAHAILGTDG